MAWLSSRFLGGETLVLGVTFSFKRFSEWLKDLKYKCRTVIDIQILNFSLALLISDSLFHIVILNS